ncbi:MULTISPECIES: hypothetical protein [unclassified Mycoplasma]|uniref:hypothetical protein n=1 Tax=unclassified Mycoplasma TaxID=2683645 RepID=UPI000FDD7565
MNSASPLEKYKVLVRKYRRSNALLVFINMAIFLMLASTTVLNLWALKLDVSRLKFDMLIRYLFLTMACASAVAASLSGLIGFLNYKKRSKTAYEKIELIKKHWTWFEIQKPGLYDKASRHVDLIENITSILNN